MLKRIASHPPLRAEETLSSASAPITTAAHQRAALDCIAGPSGTAWVDRYADLIVNPETALGRRLDLEPTVSDSDLYVPTVDGAALLRPFPPDPQGKGKACPTTVVGRAPFALESAAVPHYLALRFLNAASEPESLYFRATRPQVFRGAIVAQTLQAAQETSRAQVQQDGAEYRVQPPAPKRGYTGESAIHHLDRCPAFQMAHNTPRPLREKFKCSAYTNGDLAVLTKVAGTWKSRITQGSTSRLRMYIKPFDEPWQGPLRVCSTEIETTRIYRTKTPARLKNHESDTVVLLTDTFDDYATINGRKARTLR